MDNKIEIERKYVIKKPSLKSLRVMKDYTESEITQIYLESEKNVTHRVRSRVYPDRAVYTETKKIRVDKMSAYEDESEICEADFKEKSKKIDKATRPILKKRYTFTHNNHVFEIDVYPDWERCAIMETELESREELVDFPYFIEIVREVTGEREYSNAAMAHSFPKEPC